jgi:hypothetical protein
MWQTDFTHYRLSGGQDVEILNFLDDHSRYLLACTAYPRVTGPAVVAVFREAIARHGVPASVSSDNGMVFTTRFAGGRDARHGRRSGHGNARNGFEAELADHRVVQKNSSPNQPQTCGKIERLHQTLKRWLAAQPDQPATVLELQALLDRFTADYNHRLQPPTPAPLPGPAHPRRGLPRPPESHPHRLTYRPARHPHPPRPGRRLRHELQRVTLRYHGRLHHIGIGRAHARTHVILLIVDRDIRIINADTGELLRELVLDPTRDYQPRNPPRTDRRPNP